MTKIKKEIKQNTLKSLKTDKTIIKIASGCGFVAGALSMEYALSVENEVVLSAVAGTISALSFVASYLLCKTSYLLGQKYNDLANGLVYDAHLIGYNSKNVDDALTEINALVVNNPGLGKVVRNVASNVTGKKYRYPYDAVNVLAKKYRIR